MSIKIFFVVLGFLINSISIFAATHRIEMVAVEASGTKIWLPSSIVVRKGDEIEVHAVSKITGENAVHGLAFPDFGIHEVIDNSGKTIKIRANKAGIFSIKCHLHAAHIGGQLIVLEK